MPDRWFWGAVSGIVGLAGALAIYSVLGETQTWDEGIHIASGYAYLTHADYRWNVEHPPLAKLMSALPLRLLPVDLPLDGEGWRNFDEVRMGIDFLYGNRSSADRILFASRSMTILLALVFLAALAGWVRKKFGAAAALLAVCLCAFDPNLLAHERYVTTDFPVTVFYFFACVLWMDYLLSGRRRDLFIAATAFALAIVTKFSAVLLIPTFAALYGARWLQAPHEFPLRRMAVSGGAVLAFTFVVVNIVYWPETLRCWNTAVPPLAAMVNRDTFVGDVLYYAGSWLRLPAHNFLYGFSRVAEHNHEGHASYLLGMRSDTGWWYYFPVVFAVKSTTAALAATGLLVSAGAWGFWRMRRLAFVWIGLTLPPVLYFVFSMSSAINIGMRHILPIYPFLYVAAAGMLSQAGTKRMAQYAMAGLAILQIAECARIAPDYLAFFNVLSGGPAHGPEYLVDSNIDWGQDVKKLVNWLNAHGTRRALVGYFGNAQLRYYGVEELNFPDSLDKKGWDAINDFAVASVTPLNGIYVPLDRLAPLRLREPVARIGWSMYVYDLRKGPH